MSTILAPKFLGGSDVLHVKETVASDVPATVYTSCAVLHRGWCGDRRCCGGGALGHELLLVGAVLRCRDPSGIREVPHHAGEGGADGSAPVLVAQLGRRRFVATGLRVRGGMRGKLVHG